MSSTETLFEVSGPVATFTFNRPAVRNALTWDMYEGLVNACDFVDRNPEVRVFVLRGAGDQAFSVGTDIRQFAEFRDGEDGIQYEARIDAVLGRLAGVGVPTIARIQGVAAGGGCAIALTCDLRICGPRASFGVPIARTLGNCLSAASCARLIAMLGPALVKDLLFTGRFINAGEAQSLGLASRLVPAEDLEATTHDLSMAIAANAPLTIRATKEIVRRIAERIASCTAPDADQIRLCYASEDFREGVAAFIEKRPPRWKGI